jgi:hypothetical protein
MPITIKIQQAVILHEIEDLYTQLYDGLENEIILQYTPTKAKRYFGVSVALVQFVSTWLKLSKSGEFILNVRDFQNVDLDELYRKDEALFSIISMVFKERMVLLKKDNLELFEKLRSFQNSYYFSMLKLQNTQNNNLVCVTYDNLFYHPAFEKNGMYVPSEFELADSLRRPIIRDILKHSLDVQRSFGHEQTSFFSIIYELMKNTFEWGKSDEKGVPFNPSLRGLIIKFFKKQREKFIEEYEELSFIKEYFASDVHKENSNKELYFLEISVFDTGAGLVKKFKSTNDVLPDVSDVDIIKRCLIKHNTSSTGINKGNKGIGLDRILKTIDKKGFLRIRTDKYSLYRNLIKDNYIHSCDEHDIVLNDWLSGSKATFNQLKYSSGTTISIFYPLSTNNLNE